MSKTQLNNNLWINDQNTIYEYFQNVSFCSIHFDSIYLVRFDISLQKKGITFDKLHTSIDYNSSLRSILISSHSKIKVESGGILSPAPAEP